MVRIRNFIGVDISKESLDFAVIKPNSFSDYQTLKTNNSLSGLKSFNTWLRTLKIRLNHNTVITFESTGFYNRNLVKFLSQKSCFICNESGLRIKKSMGILRGKSDTIDSCRIAEYSFVNISKLTMWLPPRPEVSMIRNLLVNRERLLKAINAIQTPLKDSAPFYGRSEVNLFGRLNKKALQGLKTSLKEVTQELARLVSEDSKLNRLSLLAQSVPGIGTITALYLIVFTNEFTRFSSGAKLASYIGVVPFEYSSGTHRGKPRISKLSNGILRRLFHMGALSAIKSSAEIRAYYERKVREGKHKSAVINAVRNKLVLRVMAVINRGTPYTSIYHRVVDYSEIIQAS